MTQEYGALEPTDSEIMQVEPSAEPMTPVPVKISGPVRVQPTGRKSAAGRTVLISSTPTRLLVADPHRASVTIMGSGVGNFEIGFSPSAFGSQQSGAATTGGAVTASSGTFSAAAAGNIALPAGASITGFDVTVAPAAATVSGLVTVTGLSTLNMNYELSETTAGTTLSVRFPGPITAANSSTQPQVNVPAITGGAAYAISVYGITAASTAAPAADAGATIVWPAGTPFPCTAVTEVWVAQAAGSSVNEVSYYRENWAQ
jgi:hypothetical protein